MQVTLLGSLFDTYSDSGIIASVRNHFILTHIDPLTDEALYTMLEHYRQYMRDGMSDAWATNEMKRKRTSIAGWAFVPTDMQIAGFVATMKQLKGNKPIQDPKERPSWSEVLADNPLTNAAKSFDAKTLLYIAGGLLIAYGIATTATKTLLRR